MELRALAEDPTDGDAWSRIADALTRRGDPLGARIRAALEASTDDLNDARRCVREVAALRLSALATDIPIDPRLISSGHATVQDADEAESLLRMGSTSLRVEGWQTFAVICERGLSVARIWPILVTRTQEGPLPPLRGELVSTTHLAIAIPTSNTEDSPTQRDTDPWSVVDAVMHAVPNLRVLRVHARHFPSDALLKRWFSDPGAPRLEWRTGSVPATGPGTLPPLLIARDPRGPGSKVGHHVRIAPLRPTREGPMWRAFDPANDELVTLVGTGHLLPEWDPVTGKASYDPSRRDHRVVPPDHVALDDASVLRKSTHRLEHGLSWSAMTTSGMDSNINQDGYAAAGRVFSVVDGMSGSHHAATITHAVLHALEQPGPLEERVRSAEQAVAAMATGRLQGCSATLASLSLDPRDPRVCWVGHCRVYRLRSDDFTRLTQDHTLLQQLLDQGLLAPEDQAGYRFHDVLLQALRANHHAVVGSQPLRVEPGDRFLMCTAGLSDVLDDDVLHAISSETPDPEICVSRLIAEVRRCEGWKDITALVVDVSTFDAYE